jgi:bifunctional non-homologous end joining protein LigD
VKLPVIEPMKLLNVADPFDHPDWIFELKHDGFRSLAYLENGQCRLVSRRRIEYKRFDSLRKSLAQLGPDNAILDGEIVCLDSLGHSRFYDLMFRRAQPIFYAFDLVWLNGKDLRELPVLERKEHLRDLIKKSNCADIINAQFVEGSGVTLYREICDRDLEGIVCKRKSSVYSKNRRAWLKVKNRDYTQAKDRQELFNPSSKRTRLDLRNA